MREIRIYFLALAIACVDASKCTEPRKPHPSSCTIFYNCVNLPNGGYVWAPAKCTDGLIFQPYLRMCVLPGDSWTCDYLATEAPHVTKKYQIPDLVDPTQTSYLGYDDVTPEFSIPIDMSHPVDEFADSNEQRTTETPYPLIEISPTSSRDIDIENAIKNIGVPIAIKHSEDNYLYHFANGQQVLSPPTNMNNEQMQNRLEHLSQLIDRLTAYQGVGIPLDRQVPPATTTTTTTQAATHMKDTENMYLVDSHDSALLSFLVKNYLRKSQLDTNALQKTISTTDRTTTTTEMESSIDAEVQNDYDDTTESSTVDLVLNGPDVANNIIVVEDSLYNKQYFTIEKYKSIAKQLTTETVTVLACTSGVRLPNGTDCTRYYSCDPRTASIIQFSCPPNTAFNSYKRVCDTKEYPTCVSETTTKSSLTISVTTTKPHTRNAVESESHNKNPCQAIGKYGDPMSESHYYLCYAESGKALDIHYQRMKCPNSLMFCQAKNVCTTRNRCTKT